MLRKPNPESGQTIFRLILQWFSKLPVLLKPQKVPEKILPKKLNFPKPELYRKEIRLPAERKHNPRQGVSPGRGAKIHRGAIRTPNRLQNIVAQISTG
jgi:hypothetical protein